MDSRCYNFKTFIALFNGRDASQLFMTKKRVDRRINMEAQFKLNFLWQLAAVLHNDLLGGLAWGAAVALDLQNLHKFWHASHSIFIQVAGHPFSMFYSWQIWTVMVQGAKYSSPSSRRPCPWTRHRRRHACLQVAKQFKCRLVLGFTNACIFAAVHVLTERKWLSA